MTTFSDSERPLENGRSAEEKEDLRKKLADKQIVGGTCPNCRFSMDMDSDDGGRWPSYNGDRILVAKFPYDFADPKRWDVIVFRFPGNAQMNYIKRLVGRPHETIRILHGDIYVRPEFPAPETPDGEEGRDGFVIVRKPADKVQAMAQTVYNNDYVVDSMTAAGWPLRWQSLPDDVFGPGWTSNDGGRSYAIVNHGPAGGEAAEHWIGYRHFVPSREDWQALDSGRPPHSPLPRLISDFYAYNTSEAYGFRRLGYSLEYSCGYQWVGDLLLETDIEVDSDDGVVLVELVRAGRQFFCELNVATGVAQLKIDGNQGPAPSGQTSVRGRGKHHLAFANVDRQLLLWVDGKSVEFDSSTHYPAVGDDIPTAADLIPARIGSRGAALHANHLVIKRDVYYIAEAGGEGEAVTDYEETPTAAEIWHLFAHPELWTPDSLFSTRRTDLEFPLAADQFFVLGDNSPKSKDSRLWADRDKEFYVKRELLIGKALFIYWPHPLSSPVPFFPNFKGMGFVR